MNKLSGAVLGAGMALLFSSVCNVVSGNPDVIGIFFVLWCTVVGGTAGYFLVDGER